ncbi:MAG: PQQ-binding-like beta-propeller repeat protein, partial [Gemmataceae bacterium]|nr:PQQ-binding-like beta-propeller repeat protein [Gemmataceae bacterium]
EKSDFIAMPVVHNGRVYIGTGQDPEHSGGPGNLWCLDLKKAVELGAKAADRDVSPELVVKVEKQADGTDKVTTKPNPCSALVWKYGGEENRPWAPRDFKFERTLSTVAVLDDVVYAAELNGYLHCLNAKTGEMYWQHDTKASVWGSPLVVDGKVLLATNDGDLLVFRHDPKPKTFDPIEAGKNAPDAKAARALQKAEKVKSEKEYLAAKIEFPDSFQSTPVVAGGVLFVATENTLYAIGKK